MSIEQYRRNLRGAARGLWSGALDYDWFVDAMWSAIDSGLRRAFVEGTTACGVKEDEWTFEEQMALRRAILEQRMYVDGLASFIEQNSKVMDGAWSTVENRVEVWVQRYNEVRERAQSMACADQKTTWVFGDTIKHCEDCSYASGRTYRNSIWDKYGYIPGSSGLACGGWRCDCSRQPTDEPVTRGRPRALRGH